MQARPLLLERAFHELLGEDTVDLDMYGLYKVMTAATQCTMTRPSSRPSMSEVIHATVYIFIYIPAMK